MLTRFKTTFRTLFLDPLDTNTLYYEQGEKLRIILSPALYWVQKVQLPIQSIREVRKLLPSLFEDLLPEANYSYSVYRENDAFFIFAYEDAKIIELLQKKGVSIGDVAAVYFAQSELSNIQEAITINETQALYLQDSLVSIVPHDWVEKSRNLDVKNIKLSKHHVTLQHFKHLVENTTLVKVAVLSLIFIVILIVQLFMLSVELTKKEEATDALFSKYALPSTLFQNRSVLQKYTKIYNKQKSLREHLGVILHLQLDKNEKIASLQYTKQGLSFRVTGLTNQKRLLQQLAAKHIKYSASLHNNTLKVECTL